MPASTFFLSLEIVMRFMKSDLDAHGLFVTVTEEFIAIEGEGHLKVKSVNALKEAAKQEDLAEHDFESLCEYLASLTIWRTLKGIAQ